MTTDTAKKEEPPAEKKEEKEPEAAKPARRLNISDCKNNIKEYIKELSLNTIKNDFKVKDENNKDANFRTNFKNKIDELQKDDNSEFEKKVEELLKGGLDGNSPVKYPASKEAVKNLKRLLLPALDKYCNIQAPMWPLKKEKAKIMKEIKNMT